MSVPDHVFVDTSVFDKAQYDFQTPRIQAFLEAIKDRSITFLLPEPTEREIRRHMKEKVESAVNALFGAANKSPVLRKWTSFPKRSEKFRMESELHRAVSDDFDGFLKNFDLVQLDAKNVDLQQILRWRDMLLAPFSGAKKDEYPDAFVVDILDRYRKQSGLEFIAVISTDPDFEAVCKRIPEFTYFSNLAAYAVATTREDERAEEYLQMAEANMEEVATRIQNEFTNFCGFTIFEDWDGIVRNITVDDWHDFTWEVVAIGENECLIKFDATVLYSADLSFDDYETAVYDGGDAYPIHRIDGRFEQTENLSGIIKMRRSPGLQTLHVEHIEFDDTNFTIRANREVEDY